MKKTLFLLLFGLITAGSFFVLTSEYSPNSEVVAPNGVAVSPQSNKDVIAGDRAVSSGPVDGKTPMDAPSSVSEAVATDSAETAKNSNSEVITVIDQSVYERLKKGEKLQIAVGPNGDLGVAVPPEFNEQLHQPPPTLAPDLRAQLERKNLAIDTEMKEQLKQPTDQLPEDLMQQLKSPRGSAPR